MISGFPVVMGCFFVAVGLQTILLSLWTVDPDPNKSVHAMYIATTLALIIILGGWTYAAFFSPDMKVFFL